VSYCCVSYGNYFTISACLLNILTDSLGLPVARVSDSWRWFMTVYPITMPGILRTNYTPIKLWQRNHSQYAPACGFRFADNKLFCQHRAVNHDHNHLFLYEVHSMFGQVIATCHAIFLDLVSLSVRFAHVVRLYTASTQSSSRRVVWLRNARKTHLNPPFNLLACSE